jgi:hypothetical protein
VTISCVIIYVLGAKTAKPRFMLGNAAN